MADSKQKLCRLVTEVGRVCEKKELRVNAGKTEGMRCSRYINGGIMYVRLNGNPLGKADCFKWSMRKAWYLQKVLASIS